MTRMLLLILAAAAAALAATYSGVLLGLYVDYVNGTSVLEYYLYDGTHYLKVAGEGLGKYLGQHVTIEAEETDGVLLAKAVRAPEPLATGINPSPIRGNLHVTAVGMKFANDNTEPLPLSYIENAVFGPYPSIKDFWETSSKRQITISMYYTYAWGTLPKGDADYCSSGYQFYQVAQDTINHLYQRGVRLPNYSFLVIVLNKQPPCEGWVLGRGTVGYAPFSTPDGTLYLAVSQVYYTAEDFDFMPVVFVHEFGHNLGLHHTGTSRYDYDSKWDVMSGGYYRVNQPSWPGSSYYTPTDTTALNKWYLGWTGTAQVGSGRVYILKCAALAGPGDVAVLFSADGRYALEYKCRTGYDVGLPASGLIIHAINTTGYPWSHWFYFYEINPNGYTWDDYIPVTQEIRQVYIPMFGTWFVFGNGTHAFIFNVTAIALDGGSSEEFRSVAASPDGTFVVVGDVDGVDTLVAKVKADGSVVWAKRVVGFGNATSVQVDADGSIYVGTVKGVVKLTPSGDLAWAKDVIEVSKILLWGDKVVVLNGTVFIFYKDSGAILSATLFSYGEDFLNLVTGTVDGGYLYLAGRGLQSLKPVIVAMDSGFNAMAAYIDRSDLYPLWIGGDGYALYLGLTNGTSAFVVSLWKDLTLRYAAVVTVPPGFAIVAPSVALDVAFYGRKLYAPLWIYDDASRRTTSILAVFNVVEKNVESIIQTDSASSLYAAAARDGLLIATGKTSATTAATSTWYLDITVQSTSLPVVNHPTLSKSQYTYDFTTTANMVDYTLSATSMTQPDGLMLVMPVPYAWSFPVVAVVGLNDIPYLWNGSNWIELGGLAYGVSASACGGRVYVVVRGWGDTIWWGYYSSGKFSGWRPLPGATPDKPATAVDENCNLYIAVRGLNSAIYWGVVGLDGSFIGWHEVPAGSTPSAPALALSSRVLYIAVRGFDNSVWLTMGDPVSVSYVRIVGSDSPWINLGGYVYDPVALAIRGGQVLSVVARGTNSRIYIQDLEIVGGFGLVFGTWYDLPTGSTPSAPSAAYLGDRLVVAVRGMFDEVYLWDGGWIKLPGYTRYSPSVT